MITKEYLQQELVKRIDGYKRGVETSTDNIVAEMKSILVLVNALPNYEKKYNEALKWMRELYPGLHGATKEDAEHYFPELRESEDERIRKALIDLVSTVGEYYLPKLEARNKILAYLERQKEQKPAEWSEEDKAILGLIQDAVDKFGFDNAQTYYAVSDFLKSLRPQPKQEWSKEDKKKFEKLAFLI